jgi:H/ACA ribonucleoprotein complex non-core subunit NAF1
MGFVMDLVGHVTAPLYSVRLYPAFVESLKQKGVELRNQLLDQRVYLVSKCLKVINAQLPAIMSKKGCDASNIYDEEVPEHDQEFSDDEKEKEAKKAHKQKLKLKRRGGAGNGVGDADMSQEGASGSEEGEI